MKDRFSRRALYGALVLAFGMHNDFWIWNNSTSILGLPIGLAYHVGFCLAMSILMALLVKYAWPHHLQGVEDRKPRR